MRPYEGLLTAMITPFHTDGRVNEDAAVAMARHLLANGSHGLVVAGTTGEAATLTDDEQVALVELIVQECGADGTIVAGAGSNDTRHAIELTQRVVEAGAEAVLSVTPYYNKPNRRGIFAHFSEVARAAVDRRGVVHAELAQQEGQAAEMVLVAVRDDDRLDVRDAPAQVREVGQHEVDPHLLGGREAQAGIDEHDPVLVLDDRHVLADLAHASQREDPQRAAHAEETALSKPWRSSMARTAAVSASSASTIGSRRVPASWPSMFSAALRGVGLAVMKRVS